VSPELVSVAARSAISWPKLRRNRTTANWRISGEIIMASSHVAWRPLTRIFSVIAFIIGLYVYIAINSDENVCSSSLGGLAQALSQKAQLDCTLIGAVHVFAILFMIAGAIAFGLSFIRRQQPQLLRCPECGWVGDHHPRCVRGHSMMR